MRNPSPTAEARVMRYPGSARERVLGLELDRIGDGAGHLGLGLEAIADPEMRVDVAPRGRGSAQLLAELAHEHVDRAVAVDHRVTPDALVDLLAAQHPVGAGQQT